VSRSLSTARRLKARRVRSRRWPDRRSRRRFLCGHRNALAIAQSLATGHDQAVARVEPIDDLDQVPEGWPELHHPVPGDPCQLIGQPDARPALAGTDQRPRHQQP
jgi:hypothetical protein